MEHRLEIGPHYGIRRTQEAPLVHLVSNTRDALSRVLAPALAGLGVAVVAHSIGDEPRDLEGCLLVNYRASAAGSQAWLGRLCHDNASARMVLSVGRHAAAEAVGLSAGLARRLVVRPHGACEVAEAVREVLIARSVGRAVRTPPRQGARALLTA